MKALVAVAGLAIGIDDAVPPDRALELAGSAAVRIGLAVVGKTIKAIGHANLVQALLFALVALAVGVDGAAHACAAQERTHHAAVQAPLATVANAIDTARRRADALLAHQAVTFRRVAANSPRRAAVHAARATVDTELRTVLDVVRAGCGSADPPAAAHTARAVARTRALFSGEALLRASSPAVDVGLEAVLNAINAVRCAATSAAVPAHAVAVEQALGARSAGQGAAAAAIDVRFSAVVHAVAATGNLAALRRANPAQAVLAQDASAAVGTGRTVAPAVDIRLALVELGIRAGWRRHANGLLTRLRAAVAWLAAAQAKRARRARAAAVDVTLILIERAVGAALGAAASLANAPEAIAGDLAGSPSGTSLAAAAAIDIALVLVERAIAAAFGADARDAVVAHTIQRAAADLSQSARAAAAAAVDVALFPVADLVLAARVLAHRVDTGFALAIGVLLAQRPHRTGIAVSATIDVAFSTVVDAILAARLGTLLLHTAAALAVVVDGALCANTIAAAEAVFTRRAQRSVIDPALTFLAEPAPTRASELSTVGVHDADGRGAARLWCAGPFARASESR